MKNLKLLLIFNVIFALEFARDENISRKAILIQTWWKSSVKLKQKLFYDLSDVRRKVLHNRSLLQSNLSDGHVFFVKQLPPVKISIKSMMEELKTRNMELKILISNSAISVDN
jgi:hypothetical protein